MATYKLRITRLILASVWAVACAVGTGTALAHFGPVPISLKNVPVPPVPGLVDGPDPIVINKQAAIVLGKALFWDTNVGSDGMACASCHFHAGADARIKNQLSPIGKNPDVADAFFDSSPDGAVRGPNYTLRVADFPFHQLADPLNPTTAVIYDSNDVVSSSGSFGGAFKSVNWFGSGTDTCQRSVDPVFHAGALGTRSVEPRNAPTVINAVFNFRNLWDGSANNIFNGSNQWGDRDPNAGVWVKTGSNSVVKGRLHLVNSALASQALSPPVSPIEMGCANRTFADLGRKLMYRYPLENQTVHWNDSVLSPVANSTTGNLRKGLKTVYLDLVKQAFNSKYWSYYPRGGFGAPPAIPPKKPLPYDQFEANFGMFFAISLQLYQSTLISDDSPFDRSPIDASGIPTGLTASELNGFQNFRLAHCALCHVGPTLSAAAVYTNAELVAANPLAFGNETFAVSTTHNVITRASVTGGVSLIDTGYANNGATDDGVDAGLGGTDPFGNPLSFADQYIQQLVGNPSGVVDPYVDQIRPCDFDLPMAMDTTTAHAVIFTKADGTIIPQEQDTTNCFRPEGAFLPNPALAASVLASPTNKKLLSAAKNSFKIPSLRNIDLTGPYMHNGGMATLEQVLEFYTRGGNFNPPGKHFGTVFIQPTLRFSVQARNDIIAFLKTLTDDRVRKEMAPFDHPEIVVPHGHAGNASAAVGGNPLNPLLAKDENLAIPAVGKDGRSAPLQPFHSFLAP